MARKHSRKRKNDLDTAMTFILGAGLVLIGVAVFFMFIGGSLSTQTQQQSGASLSTIPMEVNYRAPDLTLKNINGKVESLTDYRNSIVLVNNWATWCPPCKAEIPTLISFYEAHKTQGFVIVGIEAGEPQNDVAQFAQSHNMTYPVWFDTGNLALSAFRNENLPSSYVIDHTGTVRLAWTGEINRDMLEKYVTPLLNEN